MRSFDFSVPQMLADDVWIWKLSFSDVDLDLALLASCLSDDEIDRAARFVAADDRERFVISRAFLRKVMASLIGCSLKEIRFKYGLYGKPALDMDRTLDSFHFNVSHTNEWVMVAVSQHVDIGIDVEEIRVDKATPSFAKWVFSLTEQRHLATVPRSRFAEAFFKGWCSKEAYLKGIGTGLSVSLDSFEVCVDPDRPPRLLKSYEEVHKPWSLKMLSAPPGHVAVLAVDRPAITVKSQLCDSIYTPEMSQSNTQQLDHQMPYRD